jgi:transcriptional regulator with XRE-family HTH domain
MAILHERETQSRGKFTIVKKDKDSSFGDRLRHVFNGASNIDIAERLGAAPSAITNYMGGRLPAGDILKKIAEQTGCDLNWLLTGKEAKGEGGVVPVQESFIDLGEVRRDAVKEFLMAQLVAISNSENKHERLDSKPKISSRRNKKLTG